LVPSPPKKTELSVQKIYAVHGSFFILTPAYFKHYPELDSGTFLFFEEYILAERLHQKNLTEATVPSIEVIHKEDSSTRALLKNNVHKLFFTLKHNYTSAKYFYQHYLK
jgi:GT2 family glycosyltransferase